MRTQDPALQADMYIRPGKAC